MSFRARLALRSLVPERLRGTETASEKGMAMMRMRVRRGRSHESEHHEDGFRAAMSSPARSGRSLTSHGTGFASGAGETKIGAGPGSSTHRKIAVVPLGSRGPVRAP